MKLRLWVFLVTFCFLCSRLEAQIVRARIVNNVRKCDMFPGADRSAKLQACHDDLPSTGGLMDATGFEGSGSGSTTVNISKSNVLVLIGASTTTFTASVGINVSGQNVCIIGLAPQASMLKYNPSTTGVLLKYSSGSSSSIARGCIRSLGFDATGNTSHVKTAVQIIDGEEMDIGYLDVHNWADSTHASIGMEIQGRQKLNVHDSTFYADQPYHVMQDPNTSIVSLDSSRFHDNVSNAYTANPHYSIDSGVILTRNKWSHENLTGGKYGVYYSSSGESTTGYNNVFEGIFTEQSTETGGASIYFSPGNALTFNTVIRDSYLGASVDQTGIYARNQSGLKIEGITYSLSGVALDLDSTVYVTADDNYFNDNGGASYSISGANVKRWCGNSHSPINVEGQNCGIGTFTSANSASLVLANQGTLLGRNAANSADIGIAEVDNNDHIELAPGANNAYFGGTLEIGGSYPCSHELCIPNNSALGGRNSGGTDSIPLISASAANKVTVDPSGAGTVVGGTISAAGNIDAPTYSVGGTPGTDATLSCGTGLAVKTITVSKGIVTAVTCGAP